jgi:hypothetical protein
VFRDARQFITTEPDGQGDDAKSTQALALKQLLDRSNFFQSGAQWYVQKEIIKNIFGYCLTWVIRPTPAEVPTAMMNLLPGDYEIRTKAIGKLYLQTRLSDIVEIWVKGVKVDVDNDLIIWNDDNTGFDEGYPFLSKSRMSAIMDEVNLSNFLSEAQKSVVTKRGAIGMFSRDGEYAPVGVFEDDKKELEEELKKTGLGNKDNTILISNLRYKWNPFTWPTKDLMLIEFDELTSKKICGVYDVPYQLLPMSGQSTYENAKQAKIDLYQSVAIPTSFQDARLLEKAFKLPDGEHLHFDFSHVPALAEDIQKRASAISSISGALTNMVNGGLITTVEARTELSRYTDIDARRPETTDVGIKKPESEQKPKNDKDVKSINGNNEDEQTSKQR